MLGFFGIVMFNERVSLWRVGLFPDRCLAGIRDPPHSALTLEGISVVHDDVFHREVTVDATCERHRNLAGENILRGVSKASNQREYLDPGLCPKEAEGQAVLRQKEGWGSNRLSTAWTSRWGI